MRPRLFTPRNIICFIIALIIFCALGYWVKLGMPLPGPSIPSTAGKVAYVTETGDKTFISMMKADGSDPVNLTETTGKATDKLPVWAPGGKDIAFVSENRIGINPQVFEMHAAPGSSIAQITHTDTPKDNPFYGGDGRIYYFDAGKISTTALGSGDTDTFLPNHEQKSPGPTGHADLFSAGGFQQAALTPDHSRLYTVMHTERGDALMMYIPAEDQQALVLLGIAPHIHFSVTPDGGVAALFIGAHPLPQPFLLFSKEYDKMVAQYSGQPDAALPPELLIPRHAQTLVTDPDSAPAEMRPTQDEKFTAMVYFDPSGKPADPVQVKDFSPDAISVSPSGSMIALTSEQADHGGIFLINTQTNNAGQLFKGAAKEITWSPDSTQIAFTSGNDIYVSSVVATADGKAPEPKAITKNGSGGTTRSFSPVWSPAKPEEQKK